MKWFRFDLHAVRHPKVTCLSDRDFRLWVSLLCIAAENNGKLHDERHLSKVLGIRVDHLLARLQLLARIGLVDIIDGGFVPHDWDDYQMKSAISTDRVREWRQKRNVSETAHDTKQDNTIQEKEITSRRDVKEKRPKRVSRRTPLEEDDWPDDRDLEIATKAGMSAATIDLEWERFRAHHMAKGSLMANWNQAWVTWVTNWKSFGSKQAGRSNGHGYEKGNWQH